MASSWLSGQVMRSPSGCACGGGCPRCQPAPLQRKTSTDPDQTNESLDTSTAVQTAQRRGAALPKELRAYFEPRFGQDFSQVRLHTDGQAAQAAQGIQAKAYTTGQNIVFGAGQYAPDTEGGKRLLAHELTHVIQQNGRSTDHLADPQEEATLQRKATVSTPGDALEKEADQVADQIMRMAEPEAISAAGPAIQREPSAATPSTTPAADGKDPAKTEAKTDPKLEDAAKKAADHPLVIGLVSDIYQDLRYGTDFSADERKKFKLKGTESASYGALYSAAILPNGGVGGLQYGDSFGSNLSTFGKYLDAIEPLTPSNSIKTDLVSRIVGLRVDEYLGSDTFLKRLKDNHQTLIFLASAAQIALMTKDRAATPSPDEGGLVDETWNADLLLAKTMVGLIFKEKLKAPGIFDVGPLLTPSHPYYAQDSYFGGNLPTGLNVDAASGPNGGDLLHLGGTVNLAKLVAPNDQNKLGAADLDDPRKYRGWQGSVWGDYQRLRPTPELADQGRVADARFRAGALFGSEGMFILTDVGGHYSGPQAKQLTSMFFTEGLAYAPAEGPLKKVGFKVTHMSWKAEDSLAPKDASGTPTAGSVNRVQPFGSFDFKLGGGSSLAVGGTAGITSTSGQSIKLSDWRGDISYTYLGKDGTADKPAFRVELSGSGSQVDYFNNQSPMLYGVRGKVQIDSVFYGAQVNTGADKIDPGRAAQMGDPHGGEGPAQISGGNSVLIVIGVLQ